MVFYFLPLIVNNHYPLFQVSSSHNSITVQNRTHVRMNILLRITHTIISQSSADSSWITLYLSRCENIMSSHIRMGFQIEIFPAVSPTKIFSTLLLHRCPNSLSLSKIWSDNRKTFLPTICRINNEHLLMQIPSDSHSFLLLRTQCCSQVRILQPRLSP